MRLIDADALDKRRIDYIVDGYAESVNDMTEWGMAIIEAPTIDAVKVVRCRECKHWEGEERNGFYYFETCSRTKLDALSDDFCSYGERREP